MKCSLRDCGKDLLGIAILIRDDYSEPGRWGELYDVIVTEEVDGRRNELVLMHPMCWERLYQELQAQEAMVALQFIMGGIGDICEALELT